MLFSEVRNEAFEQGSRPQVASSFDLLIELCTVATALLPPLENIGLVGIKQTASRGGPTAFGKGLRPDELADGFASHPKASRNFMQTHTLLMQCADSFIAAIAVGPARLGVRLGLNRRRRPSLSECGRHVAKVLLVFHLFGCVRSNSFLYFPACFFGNGIRGLLFHFR
jgi:hypothetical protein